MSQDKNYQEALKRIKNARKLKSEILDLSFLNLTSIPPELGKLDNIRKLWLRDNNFDSLPQVIGELVNITALSLRLDFG